MISAEDLHDLRAEVEILEQRAEKAEAQRDEFHKMLAQSQHSFLTSEEIADIELERQKAVERAEKAEAAVAVMREALEHVQDWARSVDAVGIDRIERIASSAVRRVGRGWMSPDVVRLAIEALEVADDEIGAVLAELGLTFRTRKSLSAGYSSMHRALAALKKAVGP